MTAVTGTSALEVSTRTRQVGAVEPLAAYLALVERLGRDQVYLLESVSGPPADRRYSFVGAGELLRVSVTGTVLAVGGVPELVTRVRAAVADLLDPDTGRLPPGAALWQLLRRLHTVFATHGSPDRFAFGFLAFFGYEAVAHIEALPQLLADDAELPDVSLVLYRSVLRVDHRRGSAVLDTYRSPAWPAADAEVLSCLAKASTMDTSAVPAADPAATVADSVDRDDYLAAVRRCREHIAVGDIYQVQIGHELRIASAADPVGVYRRLRARNPSPYMYLVPVPGGLALGASPELFARVDRGVVTMRPIAGTLPCDPGPAAAAAAGLAADPKEIAEHVMLVDLCRNDIGRICSRDTLAVPDMLVVQRFARVLHLVSTVVGEVAADADGYDVIAALFPAGTMTGAPKVRAMEIIDAVERNRRGVYSGVVGLIDVGGYLNLALCIRSLTWTAGRYLARASAGIVEGSVPEREWRETLAKLSPAHWAVTGSELLP